MLKSTSMENKIFILKFVKKKTNKFKIASSVKLNFHSVFKQSKHFELHNKDSKKREGNSSRFSGNEGNHCKPQPQKTGSKAHSCPYKISR